MEIIINKNANTIQVRNKETYEEMHCGDPDEMIKTLVEIFNVLGSTIAELGVRLIVIDEDTTTTIGEW